MCANGREQGALSRMTISSASRRNPIARRRILRRELAVRGAVSVAELSDILGASSATIRRDLDALAREGVVERGYGGAAPRTTRQAEEALAIREHQDVDEKRAIARSTAGLIKSGETVFLNDGSTVMALARELVAADLELFVVTSAVNVAHLLVENPRFTVCLLGGFVRRSSLAVGGTFAEAMLEQFNADVAVLSSDAFSVAEGMSFTNADDALLSRKMAVRAKRCIAMMTSPKFAWNARLTGVPISEIDVLVTDALPADLQDDLAAANISVIEAPSAPAHER
ncbi:MAG: DeoR/GlpR transcriptional regulator [Alphaproteobacteria bacterium]|nr:DeoR/GlpR transcriptional regulator [Alphaproteobacteria bacterium]